MINAKLTKRVLELAVTIQQIPAPTFAEYKRAEFVRQQFIEEGLADVSIDDLGNVYARLPGINPDKRPFVLCAHTDTVFPVEMDLAITRRAGELAGAGIGDNSLGVAGLFAVLWALRAAKEILPTDLWLVANVGEEGLGDLNGMRVVVDHFGDLPTGYIILEGMAYGQVYHRALGSRRYRIAVETVGGHSWVNYGTPSAIHELAALIQQITALALPASPRTTLNVGVIAGGTSVNTIAPEAYFELDLRSESVEQLTQLVGQIEDFVAAANHPGVMVTAEVIGDRPAGEIDTEHPLVQLALESLQALGEKGILSIGSTDANIPLSRGIPAICIGITQGGGAHTTKEYIVTEPVGRGLAHLLAVVRAASQRLT